MLETIFYSPEFYADLCNVIDKAMCKISGFDIPDEIPSTSPEARACANKVIGLLEEYKNKRIPVGINH